MNDLEVLLQRIRNCSLCAAHLAHGVRPVLQVDASARILVVGQAPGRRVHESGKPFSDASGQRLRHWLGVDERCFYDPKQFAIVPIGLCYPGKGKSGDLPPRPECAPAWHGAILRELQDIRLTVVLGRHARMHHTSNPGRSLTDDVGAWDEHLPGKVILPHPSPRNNLWLKRHPWFERDLVPVLRRRVGEILCS